VLGAALFGEYAELSDLSGDTKELIKNYNTLLQQWEVTKKELEQAKAQLDTQQQQLQVQGMAQQQEQQGVANEMQNYGQMQALAQAEAEQTMGAMQPPAEAAGSAMQYPGESYPAQPPGYAQS
jgi:peptidoglycan hydrolase CwlO-like protein